MAKVKKRPDNAINLALGHIGPASISLYCLLVRDDVRMAVGMLAFSLAITAICSLFLTPQGGGEPEKELQDTA